MDATEAVDFFVIDCFFDGFPVKASFQNFVKFVLDERKRDLKELGSCLVLWPGCSFVIEFLQAFFEDNLQLVASVIFLVCFFSLLVKFDFVRFWLFEM